ncbi:CoA binding protein [Brevibacillus brevis]|nr:CoA binding protein [Brevibacillus brevis]VEF89642.1 Redox-sensing transcriptional repressor rex [Brevibacillus brevis]
MRIAAIFDNNPEKQGKKVAGIPIQPLSELEETIVSKQIKLAIITVPAPAAQSVCDQLTQAGIRGILNFAPTTIRAGKDVRIHYADVTSNLQSLAYYLT